MSRRNLFTQEDLAAEGSRHGITRFEDGVAERINQLLEEALIKAADVIVLKADKLGSGQPEITLGEEHAQAIQKQVPQFPATFH